MKGGKFVGTIVAAVAAITLLTPAKALAANTTCANADFLALGQMGSYTIAASGALFFKVSLQAGRSYSLNTWAPFQDAGEGGVSLNINAYTENTCTTVATAYSSTDFEPTLSVDSHFGDGDSIVPATSGTYYLRVDNGVAFAYTIDILVTETTLFSPWWFTGGTNQAYVEVRNSMNATTTATLTIYQANGAVCGTSPLTLGANANAAVEINTIGTCAGALSGSAQLSFFGTPAGLTANITTINVPNGTSFDSPFSPRMVWGTFTR